MAVAFLERVLFFLDDMILIIKRYKKKVMAKARISQR
jgi:hypothetical protein